MNNEIRIKIVLFICMLLYISPQLYAQQTAIEDYVPADSLPPKKPKKQPFWVRFIDGNVDRTFEKKFDISLAASPSYTREASFGIGGMASGLYRLDRTDSIMPPSNITIVVNTSLRGFYGIESNGNNYFKGNKSILSYKVGFTSKRLDFWGINYDACAINPSIDYTRQQIQMDANYQYRLFKNIFIGSSLNFTSTRASKINDASYLEGQKLNYTATGLGFLVQYDSRDFIPNPKRGIYIMLRQTVFPQTLGNVGKTIYRATFTANFYQKMWHGALIATDLYGQSNSENAPWTLREELGGNLRMRGYYGGRYIDDNILSFQVELRQHIYQRFGCVVWGGGGTVFPSFNKIKIKHVLPTYGLGLRWEFKHNVNARIDYGFGKDTRGFVFNISEAF